MARALAARPYQEPRSTLPESYKTLNYDAYRDIRFRPEKSWWRQEGLPFQAQFFHPGFFFLHPVAAHEVVDGREHTVRFSPDYFTYGPLVKPGPLKQADGFAGMRLTHPINRADHFDEVGVFQGASYFRSLGAGNVYGLSARGLAIDTAGPRPEEFPSFRELWLERPKAGDSHVVVHALMDSQSVTGAYRFTITPGANTVMDVEATLFARKPVEQLGVAPLTSMYLFGENDRGAYDDFRPEVHDSDGLFVWTKGGEQLWRPLQNPGHVNVSSFHVEGLRAFGLLQRDTAFTSYEDLEARYERRPSAWVEPVGDWGAGVVRLAELPTPDETNDNIVAFWVPERPFGPGEPLRFAYRLHWGSRSPFETKNAFVTATRVAAGDTQGARRFILDFSASAQEGEGPVEAVITAASGQVLRPTVTRHEPSGGWRATFELLPTTPAAPTELRAFLKRGSETLTETWSYLWIP
ncbi:glucan biosynthesis protein [Myxococcus stipitatus]|uniref:glucan biosynthesis protein n=1 Tax=Myxococcus stipitatus TaxID=83455 RepID=UPI001F45A281|nr:glucan biosynthesis protein [Myxococcus stipitatus]MCE9666570.1 glucan biosynthesis protein [Myxococcus stipitatus]